jgi:hypothetical protein
MIALRSRASIRLPRGASDPVRLGVGLAAHALDELGHGQLERAGGAQRHPRLSAALAG